MFFGPVFCHFLQQFVIVYGLQIFLPAKQNVLSACFELFGIKFGQLATVLIVQCRVEGEVIIYRLRLLLFSRIPNRYF
jgi:membrane-bound metal-dependent hydrolase YbcI (DUF457 family)